MDEVEKLKAVNANLEQRKEELVKELEQVDKHWTLERLKSDILWNNWGFRLDYQPKRLKRKVERLERLILQSRLNQIVPRDQVFPWIVAYSLLLLHKNK